MGSKKDKQKGFTRRERFEAEYPDYDFLDKPMDGYPPGTTFDIDGQKIDVTAPGGEGKKKGSKPAAS